MLAFGLDMLFAYLIVRRFQSYLLIILLAFIGGVVSSLATSAMMFIMANDLFTPGELFAGAATGFFWHPVITIVAAIIYRYTRNVTDVSSFSNDVDIRYDHAKQNDDIDDFIEFLKQSPTDSEISSRVNMLINDGYDQEILIDIVKERAGISEYEMLRRVL